MQKLNDLSRCLTPLEPDGTLIAVIFSLAIGFFAILVCWAIIVWR